MRIFTKSIVVIYNSYTGGLPSSFIITKLLVSLSKTDFKYA